MQKHILKEQFTPFLFSSPSCCFKPVCCFCLFFLLKHKSRRFFRVFTRTITQSAHMSKTKTMKAPYKLLHTTSIFLRGSFKRGTHHKSWNKVCDLQELLLHLRCVLLLTGRSLNCHYNKKKCLILCSTRAYRIGTTRGRVFHEIIYFFGGVNHSLRQGVWNYNSMCICRIAFSQVWYTVSVCLYSMRFLPVQWFVHNTAPQFII